MPYKYDFAAIKREFPILDVVNLLGLTIKEKNSGWRGPCPVCDSGNEDSFTVTPNPARADYGQCSCFRCRNEPWGIHDGTDSIGLVKLVRNCSMLDAAKYIKDSLGSSRTETRPQRRQSSNAPKPRPRETNEIQPSAPEPKLPHDFDPEKFASRLVWNEEVEKLGIGQRDAERLGIGWHTGRKAVCFPIKNPDASYSAFIMVKDGKLIMPPQWLATNNVVALPKRA